MCADDEGSVSDDDRDSSETDEAVDDYDVDETEEDTNSDDPFGWISNLSSNIPDIDFDEIRIPETIIDPEVVDSITQPTIDPEVVDSISQPTIDPEVVDSITQPTIDPEVVDSITQPTIDPEVIDSISQPTIDPEVIDSITQPTIDPEMLDSISQSTIDPEVIDSISLPEIDPEVINSLAQPAIEPDLIRAIDEVDLAQVMDAYEFAAAFDQIIQESPDQGSTSQRPPETGGFASDFLNIITLYLLNNPDILTESAKDHANNLLQTSNVQLKAQELADIVRSLGAAGHTALVMASQYGARLTYIIHFSDVSLDEQSEDE